MPRPKVTRPEIALHRSANTPAATGATGFRTALLRISTSMSRPAEAVPAIIIVVRTPSTAIRYGDTTLYDTGCMPPYQARLYAEPGFRPTNSAHASCAARSPPLFANVKNQMMWRTPATAVAMIAGCRTKRCRRVPSRPPAPSSRPPSSPSSPSSRSSLRSSPRRSAVPSAPPSSGPPSSPGPASGAGPASRPGWASRLGPASRPGAVSRSGPAPASGSVSASGTASRTGWASRSGPASGPGSASWSRPASGAGPPSWSGPASGFSAVPEGARQHCRDSRRAVYARLFAGRPLGSARRRRHASAPLSPRAGTPVSRCSALGRAPRRAALPHPGDASTHPAGELLGGAPSAGCDRFCCSAVLLSVVLVARP